MLAAVEQTRLRVSKNIEAKRKSPEEMETYQDLHFIKKYCEHIAIPFEDYQTLLNGEPSAELLACELFQDYKKDFDQSSDIKKLAL